MTGSSDGKGTEALALPQADRATHEQSPQAVSAVPVVIPSARRPLRGMTHEELVHECAYRGAELVIERTRTQLLDRRFNRALERAWTDFLDANPDDLTGFEEYPDHAFITFEQMEQIVAQAIEARGAETQGGSVHESAVPEGMRP